MGAPLQDASPWARVRLVTGRSPSDAWEVRAEAAGARVDVGANPRCAWRIEAPGVAPHHVDMYWDGEVLWVADLQGAGGVTVDGLPVDDWVATAQGSTIAFGTAKLCVETGGGTENASGIATREGRPNAQAATEIARPLARGDPRVPGPRAVPPGPPPSAPGPGGSPLASRPSIPEAKTVMLGRGGTPTPEKGRAPMPPRPEAAAPLRRPPLTTPMPDAQERLADALPPGGDPNATRLVEAPSVHPPLGRPTAPTPPPRIGGHASVARASRPSPLPPRPADMTAPAGRAQVAEVAEVPGRSQTPGPSSSPDVGPDRAAATGTTTASGARFAAPPPPDSSRRKGGPREMSLPPRTWILIGITVAALAAVLLMSEEDEAAAPSGQAQSAADAEDRAQQDAGAAGADAGAAADGGEQGLGALTVLTGPQAQDDQSEDRSEAEDDAADHTAAREAVDALMGGRQREALTLYRRLLEAHREVEAYADIVRLLERRLRARCRDGVDPSGEPCDPPQ